MNIEQGVIMAVLAHAAATVWWASKTNTILGVIKDKLTEMTERFAKEDGKLEIKIDGAFKRVDELRDRVTRLEAVNNGGS